MHADRLMKLAAHIRHLPDGKLDMGAWIKIGEGPEKRTLVLDNTVHGSNEVLLEGFCGAVVCALGSAAFIPEFRARGLSAYRSAWGSGVLYADPATGHYHDCNAGAKFFDIEYDHATVLFGSGEGDCYAYYVGRDYAEDDRINDVQEITPEMVANGIERFVRNGGTIVFDFHE